MRRKIEKYMSRKQGCEEHQIRYTDDGRIDFMGDLEGVLAAVRGKDRGSRTRSRKSNASSTSEERLKRNPNSSDSTKSKNDGKQAPGFAAKDVTRGSNTSGMNEEDKENVSAKGNVKPMGNEVHGPYPPKIYGKHRETPGHYDYLGGDRRMYGAPPMGMTYPFNPLQRQGANQGPYSEQIRKGSVRNANIFTFSPSNSSGSKTTDRSKINADPNSTGQAIKYESVDSSSRWTKDHGVSQDSSFFSPSRNGNPSSSRGLTPLSNFKANWCSTPLGEDLKRLFSPDEPSSQNNIFSSSWDSEMAKDKRNEKVNLSSSACDRPKICISQLRIGDDNSKPLPQSVVADSDFRHVIVSPISHVSLGKTKARTSRSERSSCSRAMKNFDDEADQMTVATADITDHFSHQATPPSKEKFIDDRLQYMDNIAKVSFSPESSKKKNYMESRNFGSTNARICSSSTSKSASAVQKLEIDDIMSPTVKRSLSSSPSNSVGILEGLPTPGSGSDDSADNFWGKPLDLFSPGDDAFMSSMRSPKVGDTDSSNVSPSPRAGSSIVTTLFSSDKNSQLHKDGKTRVGLSSDNIFAPSPKRRKADSSQVHPI